MNRPSRNAAGPHRSIPSGTIRADELMPIREALERLGWGSKSLAAAKRAGLRVLSFGARSYLLGSDLIAFLANLPVVERPTGGGRPDLVARRKVAVPDSESGNEAAETREKSNGNGRVLRKTLSEP